MTMTEKEEGNCAVCDALAKQKCAGCQAAFYCSRDHQKQHWKRHKLLCAPARVREDPIVGRYLEATRDIQASDIILKEKPMIVGPAQTTPPVCLGCYKLLDEGGAVPCELCGWPCCSPECANREEHRPECYFTQQRGEKVKISTFGVPHPNYECLTVLRCLYQRDHNPKLWSKLMTLQSHCEQRRGTLKWQHDLTVVANFIWSFFKLEGKFSEEEIMKCCGILQINGHEVPLTEPEHLALFERVSMAEHSCHATANKSFTSEGEILLCAGVNIPRGTHVSVCYTDPLWGTEARRHHLADAWLFECRCIRCEDVTDLGTMYSAVKCKKKDCKGYLLPPTFIVPILHKTLAPDPVSRNLDDKPWVCSVCADRVSDEVIQQLLQDIGREVSAMPKGDPDACEKFISHCSSYLHPSHYYMSDVALALAQLIGQQPGGLPAVSEERLSLKTQLCRQVADLIEILAPAETRSRGSVLFELHAALAEIGRRRGATGGPAVMLGYIQDARAVLSQAARLLRHEPAELPEGRLARQAAANLLHIDALAERLTAALPSPL